MANKKTESCRSTELMKQWKENPLGTGTFTKERNSNLLLDFPIVKLEYNRVMFSRVSKKENLNHRFNIQPN